MVPERLHSTTRGGSRDSTTGSGACEALSRAGHLGLPLHRGGNEVTAVVIYDVAQEAQLPLAAAFSVIVDAINLGVVALAPSL